MNVQETQNVEGIATTEELAALDFEPWQHRPDEWTPGTNGQWINHAVVLRMGWAALFRSKTDLTEMTKSEEDATFALIDNVQHTLTHLRESVRVLEAAQARFLSAASSAALESA